MWWYVAAFVAGVIVGAVGYALVVRHIFDREIGRMFGWF